MSSSSPGIPHAAAKHVFQIPELIVAVFEHLSIYDLLRVEQVCKHFNTVINNDNNLLAKLFRIPWTPQHLPKGKIAIPVEACLRNHETSLRLKSCRCSDPRWTAVLAHPLLEVDLYRRESWSDLGSLLKQEDVYKDKWSVGPSRWTGVQRYMDLKFVNDAFLEPTSWSAMHLTQPPVKRAYTVATWFTAGRLIGTLSTRHEDMDGVGLTFGRLLRDLASSTEQEGKLTTEEFLKVCGRHAPFQKWPQALEWYGDDAKHTLTFKEMLEKTAFEYCEDSTNYGSLEITVFFPSMVEATTWDI